LRIYRNNWRSTDEIIFELELLSFLHDKGAPVSYPLLTRSGESSFYIDSPEGKRSAALFHYAKGHAPGNKLSTHESELLGKTVANIHRLSDDFTLPCTRPVLDIPYLLDDSINAIQDFVNQETLAYLKAIQHKLSLTLPQLAKEQGQYGICTGDVNPTNFHIDGETITVFDFDQCGYGYRAFEIAKFISSIHTLKNKADIANAFLVGYQQVRRLSSAELSAIPYFEMVAVIWVMAINANNSDLIGHKWLEKPFWERKITVLKELEQVLF
jgi:Ser/Thr protein kinase RdoA (MazF antagonist)